VYVQKNVKHVFLILKINQISIIVLVVQGRIILLLFLQIKIINFIIMGLVKKNAWMDRLILQILLKISTKTIFTKDYRFVICVMLEIVKNVLLIVIMVKQYVKNVWNDMMYNLV